MKPHFIVSDLHMGDGTGSDDFKINKQRFLNFLSYVKGQGGQLIMAGDVFELWQSDLQSILKAYPDVIERLFELRPVLIAGNHDYYLRSLADLSFLHYPHYMIEDLGIRVEHGHEHDPHNDPRRNMELGKLVATLGGVAENWIHEDIDEEFMTFAGKARKVAYAVWNEIRTPWKEERQKKKAPDLKPFEKAVQNIIQGSRELEPIRHVIFGHTHRPDIRLNNQYINTGCWVTDQTTFVEVNGERIALREFRGKGRIADLKQVELEQ